MNIDNIKNTLSQRFLNMEEVAPNILCATDRYQGKPYAVRYFDLGDNIVSRSQGLNEYLENVLGEDFFDIERPIDLRWNNYLYFITSEQHQPEENYIRAKSIIESNREYARKFVITEKELPKFFRLHTQDIKPSAAPIRDIYSTWLKLLNDQQLGYILDFNLSAPAIVRKIETGKLSKLEQTTPVGELNVAEKDAIIHPIQHLVKKGFRKYPKQNEFQFGSRVNLITGPNGHGKTSLLEIIEYLYCKSTYRNGDPRNQTRISASLFNSLKIFETDSIKTNPKRLKARNLGWYGKNDVRGSTLCHSFARFNFMDTDAAIRLSVEATPEQLSEDIALIVLGAEAGKASDQIRRIQIELEKKYKLNENDSHQLKEKIQLLKNEKESLNSMTKQSDTFFQQLKQQLQIIHWKNLPDGAEDISVKTISENLEAAIHQCKLLEDSNIDDLKTQRQDLEAKNLSLTTFIGALSNIDKRIRALSIEKEKINYKFKIFEELRTYSDSDLFSIDRQQKDQTSIINELQAKLPDIKRIDLIDKELAKIPLEEALAVTDKKLTEVLSEKAGTIGKIEEFERTHTIQRNLRDQLVSTASKIIKLSSEKDRCPLCQTQFEEGQFLLRIANETMDDSALRSTELRNKLANLQNYEADLQQIKSLLIALIKYSDGDANIINSTLILTKLEEDKQRLSKYQESLKRINAKLDSYKKRGLEINRFKELIGLLGISKYNSNELDEMLRPLQTESIQLTKEINSKKIELDEVNHQVADLSKKIGSSEALPTGTLSKMIESKLKSCSQKIAAAQKLSNIIELKNDFSPVELFHQITDARDTILKFITTRKREEETSTRYIELEKQVEIGQDNLLKIKTTLKYLSKVRKILTDLLSGQNSIENIKQELLKKNGASIAEIFSKIHLPNEYDINIEGKEIKLIHKTSGEARSLKEVSSGQRAAFALALFLTMNKTLGNGPRVLLLDDPISHVDDINMLSFLDYLRDLAIGGERQIFFATPNAKLASLFRHKFKFLGNNDFKEICMSR